MKRINYAGGTLETGDAVAQAMVDYVTSVSQAETNITVDIRVREPDGNVATHSVVLGPGTQLDVTDADSDADARDAAGVTGDEASMYPVPEFGPPVEMADSAPPEEADQAARDFDKAVADIEHDLDHGDAS